MTRVASAIFLSAEIVIELVDAGTVSRKWPLASDIVPICVFFAITETFGMGKLSFELVMIPVIVLLCAVTHRCDKSDNEITAANTGSLVKV